MLTTNILSDLQPMLEQPNLESREALLEGIWRRRELGIHLPTDVDFLRPITHADIEYLCNNQYPFLQVMNTAADFESEVFPEFVGLPNGWVIFDYQDAMSTSYSTKSTFKFEELRGNFFIHKRLEGNEEESGGEGGGFGTVINQQFETVFAVIREAKKRGWSAIEIIAGSSLMQFYAWAAAQKIEIDLHGFMPTTAHEKQYKIMLKNNVFLRLQRGLQLVADEIVPE